MKVSVGWFEEQPKAEEAIRELMKDSGYFGKIAHQVRLEPVRYSGLGLEADFPSDAGRLIVARHGIAFECDELRSSYTASPNYGLLVANVITLWLWHKFHVRSACAVDGQELGRYAASLETRVFVLDHAVKHAITKLKRTRKVLGSNKVQEIQLELEDASKI